MHQRHLPNVMWGLVLLIMGGCAGSTAGDKAPRNEPTTAPSPRELTQRRLEQPISVNFDQTPLRDALEEIGTEAEVSIAVNWKDVEGAGVGPETPVTLHASDMPAADVLGLALELIGGGLVPLSYNAEANGVVVVATDGLLAQKTFIRVYAIGDLIQLPRPIQAPRASDPLTSIDAPQIRPEHAETIDGPPPAEWEALHSFMDLVRNSVDPDNWRTAGGLISSMEHTGDLQTLVVRTNRRNHDVIGQLLDQLRRRRLLQCHIQAKVLLMDRSLFERHFARPGDEGAAATAPLLDHRQVADLLAAVRGDTRSEIIAAPQISAVSGQRATIISGRQNMRTAVGEDAMDEQAAAWEGLLVDVEAAVSDQPQQVTMIMHVRLQHPVGQKGAAGSRVEATDLRTRVAVPAGATLAMSGGVTADRHVVVLITPRLQDAE